MPRDWTEWMGGENPLPPHTLVEFVTRRGIVSTPVEADKICWIHNDSLDDVIQYRIVKSKEI